MKSLKDRIFENPELEFTFEDIVTLPYKSQYRLLAWYGTANNTILTQGFDLVDIQGRIIVIKGIRLIPYANGDMVDFFVNDGATDFQETIPGNARIDRVFDVFPATASINCILNGSPVAVFSNISGTGYFPVDLWVDNILYKFPEPVETWDFRVTAGVFNNINTQTSNNPLIKVIVECYLI